VSQCVNDDVWYRQDVAVFTEWCKNNFLELNVKKTKEMIIDFRSSDVVHSPLYIDNELVECVAEYKYLGTIIDNNISFNQNVDAIYKKVNSRMYFLRQLCKLQVDCKILDLFYTSVIQPVISFSIICWFGNCSAESKSKLTRIIKISSKLGVAHTTSLEDLFKKCAIQRCKIIINNSTHPLSHLYRVLPSGRRLRSIKCRTTRYSKSFVPASVKLLNDERLMLKVEVP